MDEGSLIRAIGLLMYIRIPHLHSNTSLSVTLTSLVAAGASNLATERWFLLIQWPALLMI